MAKTQLSSVITSPNNDFICFLNKQKASILACYSLFDSHSALVLDLGLFFSINNVVKV